MNEQNKTLKDVIERLVKSQIGLTQQLVKVHKSDLRSVDLHNAAGTKIKVTAVPIFRVGDQLVEADLANRIK